MGMIGNGEVVMCGNFAKVMKKRPKKIPNRDCKWIEPYSLKYRVSLGRVKCDCKELEWHYQPYYGFSVYHTDDCATLKHLKRYPGINNLIEYSSLIAQSD